jgi:branched-chain amino acid transport system permease protein
MDRLAVTLLGGISYGMLLFLIASGLSLILGLMGVVNLAHGAVFMIGGYVGITVAKATGNLILGVLAGTVAAGIVGLFIERLFLRNLYRQELSQILVTFGFVYIITNVTTWIWGPFPKTLPLPSLLEASIPIGSFAFPAHRFMLIIAGFVVCFALWWLQEKTKIGAIIRAGMDDARTVSGLGINLRPITIGVFVVGSLLAGFGCVIAAPMLGGVDSSLGTRTIFLAIAVVVVGGVGSVQGALAGSLLIGILDNLATSYLPELSMYTMYIAMIIIVLFRPSGLIGREFGREY